MLLFAGDPHGNFDPIIQAANTLRPEGILLLGDYDLDVPLDQALAGIDGEVPLFWIPGNHDGDSQLPRPEGRSL